MPVIQPEGAIATRYSGIVVDAKFAPDGSLLVASRSTIIRIDPGTGTVLDRYVIGGPIDSFDVSADGRYIVASQSVEAPSAIVRYDTQSDTATRYEIPSSGTVSNPIGDVALLNDGTVLLAQRGYGDSSLLRFDFATGTVISAAGSKMTNATLITSADHDTVYAIGMDRLGSTYLYSSASGIIRTHLENPDPYGGASVPPVPERVGAISPDESLFASSFSVLNAQLRAPQAGFGSANGMVFNPGGDRLYVIDQNSMILAYDTTSWKAVAAYSILATVADDRTIANGDILQISDDGRYLSVVTTNSVEVIDLSAALPLAGPGDDVVDEGRYQFGLGGNDTLGSAGYQIMVGGEGDDTYIVDTLNDSVSEAAGRGTDTILLRVATAPPSFYYMPYEVEVLTFVGTGSAGLSGNDIGNTITGGSSGDVIYGNGGADTLFGGDGNDTLASGSVQTFIPGFAFPDWDRLLEHDTLVGGAGNDALWIGYGDDADGGSGTDTLSVSFHAQTTGVVFDSASVLSAGVHALGEGVIQNIEQLDCVLGTDFADRLTIATQTIAARVEGGKGNDIITANGSAVTASGGAGNDTFFSGSAADTFDGGDGVDTVSYANSAAGVTLTAGGPYLAWTGAGGDTLTSVEKIVGSRFADTLAAGTGNPVLWGDDGNDTLVGGAGKDELVGGAGDDVLVIADDPAAGEILEGDAGFDTLEVRPATGSSGTYWLGNAAIFQVEQIRFGSVAGHTLHVGLTLGQAMEQAGGGRLTHVAGGDGFDFLSLDASASLGTSFAVPDLVLTNWSPEDVIELRVSGSANCTLTARDGLAGTQLLSGGTGSDTLIGSNGSDVLDGGAGSDTMKGGSGDDTYVVDSLGDIVSETLNRGIDTVETALATYKLGANVENLTGLEWADQALTGNALANVISGGGGDDTLNGVGGDDTLNGDAGQDTLDGGTGDDWLRGGTGDDIYYADGTEIITELADEGIDLVRARGSAYALDANVENLAFAGTGDFTGHGNALNNTLDGGAGNDTLEGMAGDDTLRGGDAGMDALYGGLGNDLYLVDRDTLVVELADEGFDTVRTTQADHALAANIEDLVFIGAGRFVGHGNALANFIAAGDDDDRLDGDAGNDVLVGLGGDDLLAGGAGDDRLYGGDGFDTASYASAGANVTVRLDRAAAQNTLGAGLDTLGGIEGVIGSGFGDTLTGNAQHNVLSGEDGNDTLNGQAGDDAMAGGLGDDTYYVDAAGDTLTEAAGAGTDVVRAGIDYTLADNVEVLFIGGAARIGTGNALANTLHGSDSNNTLSGLAGDDTIRGGGGRDAVDGGDGADLIDGGVGKDTLTGGTGRDVFQFREGDFGANRSLADVITDFSQADREKIHLSLVDADVATAGNQAFAWRGSAAFTNVAGQLHYAQAGGHTYIEGDTNGDGIADFVIALSGTLGLVASDFVL